MIDSTSLRRNRRPIRASLSWSLRGTLIGAFVLTASAGLMPSEASAKTKTVTPIDLWLEILEETNDMAPDVLAWVDRGQNSCVLTAGVAQLACGLEASDDHWAEQARCTNVSLASEIATCRTDATANFGVNVNVCEQQLSARVALCDRLGPQAYEFDISPAQFVDPTEIGKSVAPNPFFPLVPGTRWVYRDGEETIEVEVTDETIEILGVPVAVVRDLVTEDSEVVEDTDDYYAQDLDGTVWYFGETAKNYEDGRLADLDGSWIAGEDGAQPGVLMPSAPRAGLTYRQEFALSEAEDAAEIVSLGSAATTPAAECVNDCLVTRDFSPLEPGVNELKYYKPGIGLILEVDMRDGNRSELIEFELGGGDDDSEPDDSEEGE